MAPLASCTTSAQTDYVTPPRILCVDDTPVNLKLLHGLLRPCGYDVIQATNCHEALEKLTQGKIDLILLDVMMPGMDGFELCRIIKNDEPHQDIPVVLVTALNSTRDRVQGIEAGADDFISKPFDRSEVLARVKMLLKYKDLHDTRKAAYAHINQLTAVGEEIIRSFTPAQFTFMGQIERVMAQFLGQPETRGNQPATVIVGLHEDGVRWHWHQYAYTNGVLEKTELDLPFNPAAQVRENSHLHFFNQIETVSSSCQEILAPLRRFGIPFTNLICYTSPACILYALNYQRPINHYDAAVCKNLVLQSLFLQSIAAQVHEVEEAFIYTVQALARAAEVNDEDTGNHITRVGEYCAILASHLALPDSFIRTIRIQAQMHDVGKIHTPPEVLSKPGGLSPEEWRIMQQHTLYGAKILGSHPRLEMATAIALSHHERWDGTGYPHGLQGEAIPLAGRITNLADQYDALRNRRVYKPPFDHATTCRILIEGDGRTLPQHFDPQVLKAFQETADRFAETFDRWQ